jgi:hypothetical protein
MYSAPSSFSPTPPAFELKVVNARQQLPIRYWTMNWPVKWAPTTANSRPLRGFLSAASLKGNIRHSRSPRSAPRSPIEFGPGSSRYSVPSLTDERTLKESAQPAWRGVACRQPRVSQTEIAICMTGTSFLGCLPPLMFAVAACQPEVEWLHSSASPSARSARPSTAPWTDADSESRVLQPVVHPIHLWDFPAGTSGPVDRASAQHSR